MQSSSFLLLLLVSGAAAQFVCPPIPCSSLAGLGAALGYTINTGIAYSSELPPGAVANFIAGIIPDVQFSVGCNFDWTNNFGTLLPPGVFHTGAGSSLTGAFVGKWANVTGGIYDNKNICMCI